MQGWQRFRATSGRSDAPWVLPQRLLVPHRQHERETPDDGQNAGAEVDGNHLRGAGAGAPQPFSGKGAGDGTRQREAQDICFTTM